MSTEWAADSTSQIKAFTSQKTMIVSNASTSAKTTLKPQVSSTTQHFDALEMPQEDFSATIQSTATPVVRKSIAFDGQAGGPVMHQPITSDWLCTVTPTVTTTVFVTGSTCPNPASAIAHTSAPFLLRADTARQASNPTLLPPVKRDETATTGTDASQSATPSSGTSNDSYAKAAAAPVWSRVAYYTSTAPAAATGFAFLANLGDPQKSGTFD